MYQLVKLYIYNFPKNDTPVPNICHPFIIESVFDQKGRHIENWTAMKNMCMLFIETEDIGSEKKRLQNLDVEMCYNNVLKT